MRCLRAVSSCIFAFLVIEALFGAVCGIRWLSMAMPDGTTELQDVDVCGKLRGLVKRQRQLCRRYFALMNAVQSGALHAISECQYQFSNRRWNCSTLNASLIFGNVFNQGTRESAFVHAISTVGVSHAVTRFCSSGSFDQCGCDRTVWGKSRKGDFEWAGCSDNIAYGNAFSKTFVDARERTRGSHADRALMNLHNNNAGRQALAGSMVVQCKCHGVSGSCELKTCWRALPSLRRVGEALKEKFDGATEVQLRRIGTRRHLVPCHAYFKPHTETDLVYLQASPDFCDPDPKSGSLGTHGRRCNRTSKAMDGCELMCCGRDFKTYKRVVTERCKCRFHWCCYVKCQLCERQVEENVCN